MNELTTKIQGLLFYTGESVSVDKIARLCDTDKKSAEEALGRLKENLKSSGLDLILHEDTARLVTDASLSDFIANIREQEVNTKLTNAQSEALAIVAYLAPVKKVKVDFIRGVNSRAVLRNLSARGLVTKKKKDGRVLYALTSEALAHLGITHEEELPDYEETRGKLYEFTETEEAASEMDADSE